MLLLTNSVDHLVNAFLGSLVFVCYGARATPNERMKTETSIYLQLLLEPLNKLSQGPTAVRNLVLLHLWHFRIRLALVLEASVPTWIAKENQQIDPFASPKRVRERTYRNQSVHEPQQSNPKMQQISNSTKTDTGSLSKSANIPLFFLGR
jgi:hypothetical protein